MPDLETDLEAVEACQFEPEFIAPCQITTFRDEAKKDSAVLTGETLHGAVLTLQSTTEPSP